MPWSVYANWSEEDLRAVLTYLRHLKPIAHRIPDLIRSERVGDEHVSEEYFGADYGAPATP